MILQYHVPRTSPLGCIALSIGLVLFGALSHADAQTTPWGWTPTDVGVPPTSGTTAFSPGLITMGSSGADVNGASDQFSFLYRSITGDATVIAKVSSLVNPDAWSQAGVMIRESSDAGSRHAFMFVTGSNGVAFRRRSATGGATDHTPGGAGVVPVWLKLERRGSTILASRSADGATWTQTESETVAMGSSVLVGLGVAAHKASGGVAAVFSNVMVVGDGPLSTGWSGRDLGSPTLPGGSVFAGTTFTLDGAGTGIGGTSDQFRFVYKQMSGDTDVVARVVSFDTNTPWARAGVMIRQGLTGTSAHASLLAAPQTGVYFDRRAAVGAGTVSMWGGGGIPPVWLKLSRKGSTVTAYRSIDGASWTMLGQQTITLSEPYYVGLAVSSSDSSRVGRASFDSVVAGAKGANMAPSVSLTSPAAGARFTAPASVTLSAIASDADGTVARVDFFNGATHIGSDTTSPYGHTWSIAAAGTYTLKAVATDNVGAATTSPTTSITIGSNVPPSVSLTAPADGANLSASPVAITATASDTDGTIARVEFYAGATLIGSDITSPYSYAWNGPAGTHVLKAMAYDNLGVHTSSAARTITLGGNASPLVSLTSPGNGAQFTATASLTLTASASDGDGSVARVEFYNATTLLGVDTSSPYAFSWTGVPAGTYALTAVARDNLGAMTVSSAKDVTVVSAGLPTTLKFAPSSDHSTVDRYVLEIFAAGVSPWSGSPVATRDVGRPTVINSECTVNVGTLITGLPPGSYFATVTAVNSEGSTRSGASTSFTR